MGDKTQPSGIGIGFVSSSYRISGKLVEPKLCLRLWFVVVVVVVLLLLLLPLLQRRGLRRTWLFGGTDAILTRGSSRRC